MVSHQRLRLYAGAVLIAVVAFGAGYFTGHDSSERPAFPAVAGIVWPPPPPLEHFSLIDARGKPFDESHLLGKWTLLFFGFTHCPDICPTTLATLKAVRDALHDLDEFAAHGQVVFVSVDAERDTPERLAAYTSYFDPEFVAATAPTEQLHRLTRQFGLQIVRVSTSDPAEYWFDHPSSVLLLGPDVRVIGEFVPPLDVSDIAHQVRAIIRYVSN